MTQADIDKAVKTITEALAFWVSDLATRKSQDMMRADQEQALEVLQTLRLAYDAAPDSGQ